MATIRAYPNGLTMGMNHTRGNPNPAKRGDVVGWSAAAVRRHTKWLFSVDKYGLEGYGWAVTLTLRDCPPHSAAWTRLRDAWLQRLRDAGVIRFHWVVEWQARGVPHIHAAVYVPHDDPQAGRRMVDAWLAVAASYGPSWASQTAKPIHGVVGWLQYQSKHAARGVQHYQRQGKPEGWEKTGRLWGYGGSWPVLEPIEVQVSNTEYYRFRRLVRSWRVADARAQLRRAQTLPEIDAARRRIRSARRMLRSSDPALSRFRGASEWIGDDLSVPMLGLLLAVAGDGPASEARAGAGRRQDNPDRVAA